MTLLKKCPKCQEYTLKDKHCEKTESAHYKFIKLRDEKEIHPDK